VKSEADAGAGATARANAGTGTGTGVNATVIEVEGRQVKLTHLAKPMYEGGFTKAEIIDYYVNVAPVLLPYLADRPATFIRYPDGVQNEGFLSKHAPPHPDWVRTVEISSPKSGKIVEYAVIEDLPTLIWAANLGVIEFHAPPWTLTDPSHVEALVLDLDPGEPATAVDCARVAEDAAEVLRTHGVESAVTTTGSKGLHLIAPLDGATNEQAGQLADAIAKHLERARPDKVVSNMALAKRPGKVFVDSSQARGRKTNISPYSLRATPEPGVATPVTWDEIADARRPEDLRFSPAEVVARVREFGDLLLL
jgi:bifunctional non-homologous end joining protein LigD